MQLEDKGWGPPAGPVRSNLSLGLSKTQGYLASVGGRGLLGHDPD
jgi:hypothetical protein